MADEPVSDPGPRPTIEAQLHELARALREARYLGPETQQDLANLVDELGAALEPGQAGAEAHVADTAAQLARALRRPHDAGLLSTARERIEEAAIRVETEAPLATGILRRIVDVLSNIGI
jgi:hypothetical protein